MKPLDPEIRNQQREREVLPLFAQQDSCGTTEGRSVEAERRPHNVEAKSGVGVFEARPVILSEYQASPAGMNLASTRSSEVPCAGEGEAVPAHPRCLPQESGLSAAFSHGAQCETRGSLTRVSLPAGGRGVAEPPDKAHARATDPQTSHKAAASVVNLGETREIILNILRKYGPQTDEGIAEHYRYHTQFYRDFKASPSGLRSRRSELVRYGLVEAAGGYNEDGTTWGVVGKTASGRACTIWRLCK